MWVLENGYRVVNVDQSFQKATDFRQKKWRVKGDANGVRETRVSPRISLHGAIGTDGGVFIALAQCNTNEDVFCLFIQKLVNILEKERPQFRDDTYFMFDTAKY